MVMTDPAAAEKTLIVHAQSQARPDIRPMPVRRAWMDATPQRFAYRCLPLNIANSHGWEIALPGAVEAVWDGGDAQSALTVSPAPDAPPNMALSHFGCAILTFPVHALFQTPPGHDLWVMGPPNRPKDGVFPLCGVIEADWSPYGFTMNWRLTRPGLPVRFDKNEPFCAFFLIPRGLQETVVPRFAAPDPQDPLLGEHLAWRDSRADFLTELPREGSEAQAERWQKSYFRGDLPRGGKGAPDHRTQLKLKPFAAD